jgi:hypothetical protein
MEEQNEINLAVNEDQHLWELRERITAKAENLIKRYTTESRKGPRWGVIAIWVVLIAVLVAIEVYSYSHNEFWDINAWFLAFMAVIFIIDRIMALIMRRYLTRMKNAGTNLQYFQAVKRLIRTHKLRQWVPLAVAFTCAYTVRYGTSHWPIGYLVGYGIVIGRILGGFMHNWNLDDDFRYDIEELVDVINQESDS